MLRISCILLLVMAATANAQPKADPKLKIVGWVENVTVAEVDITFKAKLDSGAKTSSIDAEVIDIRKVGKRKKGYTGEQVVFSIKNDNNNKSVTFERDIVRYVRIKKKNGGFLRRPVIKMELCIAGRQVNEEVNLANRENFIYPLLIGRNMMQHAKLSVDPSRTFVSRARCTEE
ncbi:MAG: ATP-dependent zinc protease [Alphaproteobacteria bacterium]|nr:ATP-dependent zinc protease [Alphaproteobacteria bacterium]